MAFTTSDSAPDVPPPGSLMKTSRPITFAPGATAENDTPYRKYDSGERGAIATQCTAAAHTCSQTHIHAVALNILGQKRSSTAVRLVGNSCSSGLLLSAQWHALHASVQVVYCTADGHAVVGPKPRVRTHSQVTPATMPAQLVPCGKLGSSSSLSSGAMSCTYGTRQVPAGTPGAEHDPKAALV